MVGAAEEAVAFGDQLERALGDEGVAPREQGELDGHEQFRPAQLRVVGEAEFVGQSVQLGRGLTAEGDEVHAREGEVLRAAGPRGKGRGRGVGGWPG